MQTVIFNQYMLTFLKANHFNFYSLINILKRTIRNLKVNRDPLRNQMSIS